MSENQNIPLEVLPPSAQMTITVSTDLYIRLQQLLLEGLPYKDISEFQDCLKKVRENTATEGLAYSAHTILYILNLIEDSAKSQGIIQKKSFDPSTQKILD